MSELLQIMLNRRSVRQYTGEPIPAEKLEQILKAGLVAPSGHNAKPVEMIVVKDKETLKRLAGARTGAANMLEHADCAIVVLAAHEKSQTTIEDCSAAMMQMHLLADSLGIGSCWIQGRVREASDGRTSDEYVREILGYPSQYVLECMLSLGMPEKHPEAREVASSDWARVHEEHF